MSVQILSNEQIEEERLDFEEYVRSEYPQAVHNGVIGRHEETGRYWNYHIEARWQGWIAKCNSTARRTAN